ncbi:tyrosine-type recombinase/integrase [Paraburkholderia sp. RL17-337-BIB-A]|uniref:tyrosine-type recombinase/integrase n=1 Tax=Paraburkholderia sp. RL17-337-BIB-A TaxID=3031636 RepID=UPI0038B95514
MPSHKIQCKIVGTFVGGILALRNLTDREIRSIKSKPGMHRVASGLYLRVTDTGAAFWMLRYSSAGKAKEMSLGRYADHSLAEAAAKATALRLTLKRDGVDPLTEKRQQAQRARGTTFKDVAADLIKSKRDGWKNAKHAAQWSATLETYAYPKIGERDVATITTEDVLEVLKPVWSVKHETATRLRQRIEAVLTAAKVRNLRSGENPAAWRGHLQALLPAIPKTQRVKHHPALPWKDLPAFVSELRARDNISATALAFTILTACRTGEVLGARWGEIDLDAALWTIPAPRMKSKRPHRVALSASVLKLLETLPQGGDDKLIFPGAKPERPLSSMAMLELLRGVRPGLTVHGFRSTFRDWVGEATSYPRELAEHALAHVVSDATEAAYRRGDGLERRKKMMQDWADFADGHGKIIEMAGTSRG